MKGRTARILHFLIVLIPYIVLLGYTAYSYPQVEGDLPRELPRILLWLPAVLSLMLPATYWILIFRIPENSRPSLTLFLGIFMAITLLALTFVIHLVVSQ